MPKRVHITPVAAVTNAVLIKQATHAFRMKTPHHNNTQQRLGRTAELI